MHGLKNRTIDYDVQTNIVERLVDYLVEYSRYLPRFTDVRLKIAGYLEALYVTGIIDWLTMHRVEGVIEEIYQSTMAENRPMIYGEIRVRLSFLQSPLLKDKPKEPDE